MASGNPAKAAENSTVKQVRAGIKAGKSATLPITQHTKVTITTTDEDEAEFITRIILANCNMDNEDEFSSFLHAMELYVTLYSATDKARAKRLASALKRTANTVSRCV